MLYRSVSTIVGTGTTTKTNGPIHMTQAITSTKDTWAIYNPPIGGLGKIDHTIYEKITYPKGGSVLQVRHYEVVLYDKRAQTVQSSSKGQQVDIRV